MQHLVLCPGSRSGPLALAAGGLHKAGSLKITTSIDERSAGFLALGLSTAIGKATVVVTTSGSAVAHLLPAAVEADRSCQPILLLTADRPQRLKNCGANQTVNQEEFLRPVCRWVEEGPQEGVHCFTQNSLDNLVETAWQKAHTFAGPVHLNLPIEEPLHASLVEQRQVWSGWSPVTFKQDGCELSRLGTETKEKFFDLPDLDLSLPGVVVVGPWRGLSKNLINFQDCLRKWQALSGWPIFADPLAGIHPKQSGLIENWELLLNAGFPIPKGGIQVLRLGPIPASRALEAWLTSLGPGQLLITEGDPRNLDPIGFASQWSKGFSAWWKQYLERNTLPKDLPKTESKQFLNRLQVIDQISQAWLEKHLPLKGQINEPSLAHWIPRLLPEDLTVMLAASSPVRDWLSFGGKASICRRCFGFRGASGIDGTLSLSMGLALALGPTVLVSGDLALLHDSNGWLFAHPHSPPLVVLLIDNAGGGIFKQLQVETSPSSDFEQFFSMPQLVDQLGLAASHNIPFKEISCLEDLKSAIEWGISFPGPVLLRVVTNSSSDTQLRNELRKGLINHLQVVHQDGGTDV